VSVAEEPEAPIAQRIPGFWDVNAIARAAIRKPGGIIEMRERVLQCPPRSLLPSDN
jgi:hypothetical protein